MSNKWWLVIRKNSVPQQGIKTWSLTIQASIITTRPLRQWMLSHSPLHGESMSSCILSSEITLVTKCNSGPNKWYGLKKFCVSTGNCTPASCFLGKHHTTRWLITVTVSQGTECKSVFLPNILSFCTNDVTIFLKI